MDNCDLEKLAVSHGQLRPEFSPEVTDYKVTVESSVEKVSLDLATSDSGASCTVVRNTVSQPWPCHFHSRCRNCTATVTPQTVMHNELSENCRVASLV